MLIVHHITLSTVVWLAFLDKMQLPTITTLREPVAAVQRAVARGIIMDSWRRRPSQDTA